jgi:DNA-binding LacI/PurR family transcriptional regulator/signal transduction histidine kinase
MAVTRPKRIAVLTAELDEAYQAALWRGIRSEATRHDVRLICFLGSRINSPIVHEAAANSVFELAHPKNVDGVIVVASAISTYVEEDYLKAVLSRYDAMPRVSVGVPVKGVSSVTVDSHRAVVEVTRHLIVDHERRHVGIIAGPRWHVESEQRRRAIEDTLRSWGVPWDPKLLVHGTFEEASGATAAQTLLQTHRPLDALFCLNDRMALGALTELHRQGRAVPEEIALVGVDDIEGTLSCTPPLTTIRQPLQEMGAGAVRDLLRLMDGGAPRETILECEAVLRESCGCPVAPALLHFRDRPQLETWPEPDRNAAERLIQLARRPAPERFLEEFNRHLSSVVLRDGALDGWERLLSALRVEISEDAGSAARETLLEQFRMLEAATEVVGEMKLRVQSARSRNGARRSATLRAVGLSLTEAFETPVLISRLQAGLRELGFSEGFLVIEEETRSQLLLSAAEQRAVTGRGDAQPVSQDLILPEGTLESAVSQIWILVPLVFQSQVMGYLVLPGYSPETGIYQTLAKQLAASLQGAFLVDRVRNHEQSLEREVERRTRELRDTNRSLQNEVATRIRLENEVAEISRHTTERIGQDLHDDLCQHLAGVAMHVGVLESALVSEGSAYADSAGMVNELIQGSVERAKAIVRGLLPVGLREEGLSFALGALVAAAQQNSDMSIRTQVDEACQDLSPEQQLELYRIVQEGLSNAVKHSGATQVSVTVKPIQHPAPAIVAEIADNGRGISAQGAADGMGLKIMRYRAEKLDAELTVVPGRPGTVVQCLIPKGAVR